MTKQDIPEDFKENVKMCLYAMDSWDDYAFLVEDWMTKQAYVKIGDFVGGYPEKVEKDSGLTFEEAVNSLG